MHKERHRSYSQLTQLRTCGEAFRLERLEKKPSRPSVPAVMGRVFHVVSEDVDRRIHEDPSVGGSDQGIDQLAHAVKGVASETLADEVDRETAKYGPPETWLHYGKQTLDVWQAEILPRTVRNYIGWRLSRTDLTLAELPEFGPAIEVPFYVRLGTQLVHGFVDRVFVGANKTLLVVDYKSGLKPKTIEQLALYRVALEANYGGDFRWGAYLYDIKNTPTFAGPYNTLSVSTDMLVDAVNKADTVINAGLFLPSPGEFCHHCGVQPHCAWSAART